MNSKKKKYDNNKLIKRFLMYYKRYKLIFFIDMIAALFTVIADITLPYLIRNITNTATKDIANLSLKYILIIAGLYIVVKGIEIISFYIMQKYGHIMGAKIEKDMRRDIFAHTQYLTDEFYNSTKIGQLLARVTTDLFDVTEFAHHGPEELLVAISKTIISFVILININIPLTIVMFSLLPLMFIFTIKSRRIMRKSHSKQRHQIGELNAEIEDSLLGIKVIRSFANEEIEIEKFDKSNSKFLDIKKGFYTAMANFTLITRTFDALMYIIVIIFGGVLLINNKISAGDFIMYTMYATTLLATVTKIVNFVTDVFEKGMSGIRRFFELMDVEPTIKDIENPIKLNDVKGDVEFKNVSFAYSENSDNPEINKKVLEDLNFNIKAGSKIALVGPSGGGKTTLTNLIPRFYDVDKGSIEIDGVDIRKIELKSLRNSIGIVQQDVYLFSGTVLDNISYGNPKASKEEIIEAAKLAGALEFIEKLPQGLNTYVGERGMMLSGGQKQRISIARVFLKNPSILILDEATSALDNKSEKVIQNSLEKLSKGRTTITIAHRLSTIINSDEIVLLTENGIQERGTHKQLINKKGEYFKLYNQVDNYVID